MPFSHVADQKWFLYTEPWDAKKDTLLIITLLAKKEDCKPLLPHESFYARCCAMDALNNTYKAGFRVIDIDNRLAFLRKRYLCFKELLKKPGTDWDLTKNIVHAADDLWVQLFEEKIFYQAYHHRGEPEFYKLATLFGANDVKKEPSHTVVIIEDSPQDKEKDWSSFFDISSSDDEVTSPIMKATSPITKATAVRKLCYDDASSSTTPVLTDYPTHANAPWLLAIQRGLVPPAPATFPAANAFPRKPKDHNNTPDSGVSGSSCASSSPFK